ncbi:FUN14-like protein [Ascosphaera apis ARSEF 7405]|uniref:FUN14-like protein n=1 Tax=Ascosphaera apis ARSEF 7405 TaxID=392613 RepID=A0A167XWY0_9EURO|nr:FUN14-like protein [Ascosphaera apis ARSEF 7405]
MSHSILFRLPYRPLILTSVAGLTWGTAVYSHSRRFPIRCDAAPRPAPAYTNRYPDERLSIENRIITPNFVKQVTLGSVAGFGLGLTLRIFSKALTFGVGVGILFFQWLASKGYHIFPSQWLEKKIRGVRLGHILEENAPFKLSIASTMLLTTFGRLEADD